MLKKRIIFITSIIMMLAFSVSAYADNYSEEQKVRNQTYRKDISNSQAQFACIGSSSESYTTLYNKSTSTFYMYVSVQEYVYDSGYGTISKKGANVLPALTVSSDSILRDYDSYIREYHHKGRVHVSSSENTPVMHNFEFVATQYYAN